MPKRTPEDNPTRASYDGRATIFTIGAAVKLIRHRIALTSVALSLVAFATAAGAQQALKITVIDTEGGQSTLIQTPQKESILIDGGYPGNGNRDFNRIMDTLKKAGVSKLDYAVVTHYHNDHVGGMVAVLKAIPVGTVVDHGDNEELTAEVRQDYNPYLAVIAEKKIHRLTVKPGDTLPVNGLQVTVVSAAGKTIQRAIPEVAATKPATCAKPAKYEVDDTENARSVGLLIRYGKFTFADLGDLTKAKEVQLVCPTNYLGHVSLFLTSHHGLDWSNSPELLDALQPRVAIMNNGPLKGGSPVAWQIIHDSKGLEELWQSHTAEVPNPKNLPDDHIANLAGHDEGKPYEVLAKADGSFSVTNTRNGLSKSYKAK